MNFKITILLDMIYWSRPQPAEVLLRLAIYNCDRKTAISFSNDYNLEN